VQEVLEHGKNGMLVDFFDVDGLANMVTSVLKRPAKYRHLRHAARETAVKRYDLKTVCLPKLCEFFEATAGKKG
jgi:glycosyltransferase involved in cell wall biosynthesis